MESTEKKTIYQRVVEVARLISPIAKKKSGTGVPYAFRGIDDLFNNLQPLLSTAGIFLLPEVIESTIEAVTNSKNQVVTTAILKIKWSFVGEDGDSISGVTVGEAVDYSDKATNKATSASLKYFLMDCFCIPTSDIADSDNENPEKVAPDKYTGEINVNLPYFKFGTDAALPWMKQEQFDKAMAGIENGEGASMLAHFLKVKMKKDYSTAIKEALVRHGICKP